MMESSLVGYHGTTKSFKDLKLGRGGAIFFSDNPEVGSAYADPWRADKGDKPRVGTFKLSIKKMADLDSGEARALAIKAFENEFGEWSDDIETWELLDHKSIVTALKKAGYDGATFQEEQGTTYAVFSTSQAKLVGWK